jgi:cell wall-associated NlpC family hydrolase
VRKIKGISLAIIATPFLFTGCIGEKISTIIPKKSTDKKIVLDLGEKSQAIHLDEKNETQKGEFPIAKLYDVTQEEASALFSAFNTTPQIILPPIESETTVVEALITPTLNLEMDWDSFSKEDEVLQTAKKFLGVKYVWAANGPSAFDCSGFTKYVFKKNGISLPRYSGHQANVGKKIKYSDLQKGDLVFFDTTKKFTKKVNHVGIFIGNHKFIHASSGGKKVMITSFSQKKFYKSKFLYARRIINNEQSIALK